MPTGPYKLSWQFIVWLDLGLNVLTGGYARETFSARCHRRQHEQRSMYYARKIVNTLFFWMPDHCKAAFEDIRQNVDLPYDYR